MVLVVFAVQTKRTRCAAVKSMTSQERDLDARIDREVRRDNGPVRTGQLGHAANRLTTHTEGLVLLWVENFEQGRSRVAMHALVQLCELVSIRPTQQMRDVPCQSRQSGSLGSRFERS